MRIGKSESFVVKDGKIIIPGVGAFHLYDTHNPPIEIQELMGIIRIALEGSKVKQALAGKEIKRMIYVPNKLINFVTK